MINRLRSFIIKDRDGVAAIEFGILAPVFFLLMIAVFEISYYIYMSTSTQRAVEKAVYDLRTGHVFQTMQEEKINIETWYRQNICKYVSLNNCEQNIAISVEQYDEDFQSFWNSTEAGFLSAGATETLMRVEAEFRLPEIMFTDMIFGEEATRMRAGLTFMTEPY